MIKKLVLAAVVATVLPFGVSQLSSAAACKTWNAKNPESHHRVGKLDIVGGKGYGSGFHSATYRSPPKPLGAYGDPQRRAAQGGYVQYANGGVIVHVNFFGPLDETDTSHTYDTAYGACVSSGSTGVNTGERCLPTSRVKPPTKWGAWTPCGGY